MPERKGLQPAVLLRARRCRRHLVVADVMEEPPAPPPTPVRFDDGALALMSLALPPVAPLCAAAADFPEPRPALPAPRIYSVTDTVDCQALTRALHSVQQPAPTWRP